MSDVHWHVGPAMTACGAFQTVIHGVPRVTCRACLTNRIDAGKDLAKERLAELDRVQPLPVVMGDTVTLNGPVIGRVVIPADVPKTEYVTIDFGTNDVTQRTVDVALLTRLGDFIASIPGNALDRKGNALAMTLRREIADVVCPGDKVRK